MIQVGKTITIKEDIINNFDVSIVMPFYKKLKEFKRVFPTNHRYFERNGIELILVLDTPDEKEELIDFISNYPFINWKIILNEKPHEWRNPAKPLNVGIRHASKEFIMVCSPESEMLTDVIYLLRQTFEIYPDYNHFAIGRVCFADNENINLNNFDNYHSIPFGSIMNTPRDGYITSEGNLIWENNSLENRISSMFSNKVCNGCRIFPLCHGGCSTRPLRFPDGYCILDSEGKKDDVILQKFLYHLRTSSKWKSVISNSHENI
ncbi:MAG: glycosyltransferase family 2 protein [Muribaculum sp.]|nr:glycosyltransferase family 2 protein [Muribaculum sp.]